MIIDYYDHLSQQMHVVQDHLVISGISLVKVVKIPNFVVDEGMC